MISEMINVGAVTNSSMYGAIPSVTRESKHADRKLKAEMSISRSLMG